jgi:ABC-type polysaccharide/polyol phosphate export permease
MTVAVERTLMDRAERIDAAAYLELLMNLTRREVKGRYSQSLFGIGWAIVQPLAMMAVFTLVFSRLGNISAEGIPYPIFAYAGVPAEKSVLVAAVDVAADRGYASGRPCRCSCPSS